MRISISYPPVDSKKGVPLLSQNRQFQYFSEPTYIYPVVPAYAATLLSKAGYEVIWDDGIAEDKDYTRWLRDIEKISPDIIMIETKTPVIKRHWQIIDDLKKITPLTKVVLVGDHVTALPRESMENSKTDFVIEGGDYDFLLLNLVKYLEGKEKALEPGIWYRESVKIKTTGQFQLNHDLNSLPFIDRELTKWRLYAYKNGNFKVTPGTYLMVGRDCWWRKDGGCSFCSWPTLYPNFKIMDVERALDEVGFLIKNYQVKEVFDDTGTFPAGLWLRRFCEGMIERGYNKEIYFSCNARFGTLKPEDYKLMKKAGFRMLLFGLESASQETLNRLNKGIIVQDIIDGCNWAREAGLEPHITIMVGYPWESQEDISKTLKLSKMLMNEGNALTLQSTIIIPYPGTKLYKEALREDWFRIDPKDYERFDMVETVLKTPNMDSKEIVRICNEIYRAFLTPKYIFRQLFRIRSLKDLKYSLKGVTKVIGHLKDF